MEIYDFKSTEKLFLIIGTPADSCSFYNPNKVIQIVIMHLFLEIISHANSCDFLNWSLFTS